MVVYHRTLKIVDGDMISSTYIKSEDAVSELMRRRALSGGNDKDEWKEKRNAVGLLTPRQRLNILLDAGSLVEIGEFAHSENLNEADRTYGDGCLYGFGEIHGRRVAFRASDPSVKGGSTGETMWRRERNHRNITDKGGIPVFYLLEAGGGRISDYLSSRFLGYPAAAIGGDHVFPRRSSRLGAVLGTSYAPWFFSSLDFNVMTSSSHMSVISPNMIRAATGMKVTDHNLGRAEIHDTNGQVDSVLETEECAIECLRTIFGYFPPNPWTMPPIVPCSLDEVADQSILNDILPSSPTRGYDVKKIIEVVCDPNSLFELSPNFAKNLVTAIARINGRPVGIFANQPRQMAGALDISAFIKARRIMRLCHAMNMPLISFVDVPGLMSDPDLETNRLITYTYEHSFTRLYTDVPKVSIILRKAYGFGLFAMNVGDPESVCFAWPSAEAAFTGPGPAVNILYRRELSCLSENQREEYIKEKMAHFRRLADIKTAARLSYIDEVITPNQTREKIISALCYLSYRSSNKKIFDLPR